MVTALAAVVFARRSKRPAYAPLAATAIAVGILLVASFSPSMLGKTYWAYRDRQPDETAIRAVALPNHANAPISRDSDWADASHAMLVQGQLRVEIRGAGVGPVEVLSPTGTVTWTKEKYLIITLRTGRRPARKSPTRLT